MTTAIELSKLVGYAALRQSGAYVSKLSNYAVIRQSGAYVSKLVSYAVLVPATTPPVTVSPGSGMMVVTGFSPSSDLASAPGAGSIVFTGFAPTPATRVNMGPMISMI